jgi:hypothetical protein
MFPRGAAGVPAKGRGDDAGPKSRPRPLAEFDGLLFDFCLIPNKTTNY